MNSNVKICTAEEHCGLDEGDCNYDNECQPGLTCGTDNCPTNLGLDATIDCCYKSMLIQLIYMNNSIRYIKSVVLDFFCQFTLFGLFEK